MRLEPWGFGSNPRDPNPQAYESHNFDRTARESGINENFCFFYPKETDFLWFLT